MAEPRTNIDIEDVLSSIRRLVADEPPRGAARPAPLILTPAFRVVDPPAPAAAGAKVAAEQSVSESAPPPEPDPLELAAAFFARSPSRPEPPSLEERIANLEAAIGRSDEEFEPDGSEPPVERMPRFILRHAVEPAPEPAPEPPRAALAEPEAGLPEPEPPVSSLPEARADQPPRAEPELRDDAAAPRGDYEEALIDEDSLREIVADLVRQELRGELGERITRNVRRMIRREVHRALLLRELDNRS